MVGQLIDDFPQRALEHARAARALGARVAVIREAAGLAAYRAGEFAEALSELRTHRRMTGSDVHLPVLADCERAMKRPQVALELVAAPGVDRLPTASQVELKIVASGARRDLGQMDAAVVVLQGKFLDATTLAEWTPRLWYAYADALLAAGREDEAREWFESAAQIDDDGQTDAAERLLELDGMTLADEDLDPGTDDDDDDEVDLEALGLGGPVHPSGSEAVEAPAAEVPPVEPQEAGDPAAEEAAAYAAAVAEMAAARVESEQASGVDDDRSAAAMDDQDDTRLF